MTEGSAGGLGPEGGYGKNHRLLPDAPVLHGEGARGGEAVATTPITGAVLESSGLVWQPD